MTILQINNLSISFAHKTCFENFSTQVSYGSRIAIIGKNGSGKSTLLKTILGKFEPCSGYIHKSEDVILGYVPQVISEFETLSGGQRLHEALTKALNINPNILLLDEPTNHLDQHNRDSVMRMLRNYPGSIIVASHDVEFLNTCFDTLWHIDNEKIQVFSGNYDNYIAEIRIRRTSIEQELSLLDKQKKECHEKLMKEQTRAAKSKAAGKKSIEQRKWPTIVSAIKASRAEETSGFKKSSIYNQKQGLNEKLDNLRLPEVIAPKFSLSTSDIGNQVVLQISDGTIGYQHNILQNLNLSISSKSKIAIQGSNGSGKSTLIKAILGNESVVRSGNWHVPNDIGYLDQHYCTLSHKFSVLENITELAPNWTHSEVRRHLNDFLFRKNEEVNAFVGNLSGGEKARLSLAQIAAKTPRLLLLDEITNNLDITTKNHVLEVLNSYPGSYIIICHDSDFLKKLQLDDVYLIKDKNLIRLNH